MNAETNSFREEEMYTALNRVREENAHLPTFCYFTDLVYEWYEGRMRFMSDPQVIVMGTGIPDELLRAAGILPCYILGGSHESCIWSDDSMPRDADPVSRSMQGLLQRPGTGDKNTCLKRHERGFLHARRRLGFSSWRTEQGTGEQCEGRNPGDKAGPSQDSYQRIPGDLSKHENPPAH